MSVLPNVSLGWRNFVSEDFSPQFFVERDTSGKQSELKITHRHLPHWELEGSYYFVSFDCDRTTLSLTEILIVKNLIIDGHKKFYLLVATVVMPDHVHLVFSPLPGYSQSRILKGTKGKSARLINLHRGTTGSIWQAESYDRIIRDENELLEKLNYMLENPLKRGLTKDPWNYPGWYLSPERKPV